MGGLECTCSQGSSVSGGRVRCEKGQQGWTLSPTVLTENPIHLLVPRSGSRRGDPSPSGLGLESSGPRGRGRVCSNKIRFRMSSALCAGVPSSASRRRWRVRSARVRLRISSTLGGDSDSRTGRGWRRSCWPSLVWLRPRGSWGSSSPGGWSLLKSSSSRNQIP